MKKDALSQDTPHGLYFAPLSTLHELDLSLKKRSMHV